MEPDCLGSNAHCPTYAVRDLTLLLQFLYLKTGIITVPAHSVLSIQLFFTYKVLRLVPVAQNKYLRKLATSILLLALCLLVYFLGILNSLSRQCHFH